MTQDNLEAFYEEHGQDSDDDQADPGVSKGRGRPAIPLQWSRVISLDTDDLNCL